MYSYWNFKNKKILGISNYLVKLKLCIVKLFKLRTSEKWIHK